MGSGCLTENSASRTTRSGLHSRWVLRAQIHPAHSKQVATTCLRNVYYFYREGLCRTIS